MQTKNNGRPPGKPRADLRGGARGGGGSGSEKKYFCARKKIRENPNTSGPPFGPPFALCKMA